LLLEAGFELLCDEAVPAATRIARSELAAEYQTMTDDDLATAGAFIQAVRKSAL
jgi:hypothetical protein